MTYPTRAHPWLNMGIVFFLLCISFLAPHRWFVILYYNCHDCFPLGMQPVSLWLLFELRSGMKHEMR